MTERDQERGGGGGGPKRVEVVVGRPWPEVDLTTTQDKGWIQEVREWFREGVLAVIAVVLVLMFASVLAFAIWHQDGELVNHCLTILDRLLWIVVGAMAGKGIQTLNGG